MSAHVNLLPPELAQRSRATRTRNLTIAAVVAWMAVLGVVYVIKLGTVAAVEGERDDAQANVDRLTQEVAELEPYQQLDRQLAARNELLATAMGTEVAWARLLNDLALAFPGNSSLLSFASNTAPPADPAAQAEAASSGDVGTLEFTGYSVQEFAPGVEAVLLRINDVRGVRNTYLSQATEELRAQTSVTSFAGVGELNDKIYTNRYAEGLPPEQEG